jgi:hypothetical protein
VGKRLITTAVPANRETEALGVSNHYHQLNIIKGVATRFCKEGHHWLELSNDPSFLNGLSPLEMKVYRDIHECKVCRDAYRRAEMKRHI